MTASLSFFFLFSFCCFSEGFTDGELTAGARLRFSYSSSKPASSSESSPPSKLSETLNPSSSSSSSSTSIKPSQAEGFLRCFLPDMVCWCESVGWSCCLGPTSLGISTVFKFTDPSRLSGKSESLLPTLWNRKIFPRNPTHRGERAAGTSARGRSSGTHRILLSLPLSEVLTSSGTNDDHIRGIQDRSFRPLMYFRMISCFDASVTEHPGGGWTAILQVNVLLCGKRSVSVC